MDYEIRAVRSDEWPTLKEFRLAALRDPAAAIAFVQTYEQACAHPDSFWRERAAGTAHGSTACQFVAVAADGSWLGAVTALLEEAGSRDVFDRPVTQRQAHLVGVYVVPEARGRGIPLALFAAAVDWARAAAATTRVRLYVHEDNEPAQRCYRRLGFVRTGTAIPHPTDGGAQEHEMVLAPSGIRPARRDPRSPDL